MCVIHAPGRSGSEPPNQLNNSPKSRKLCHDTRSGHSHSHPRTRLNQSTRQARDFNTSTPAYRSPSFFFWSRKDKSEVNPQKKDRECIASRASSVIDRVLDARAFSHKSLNEKAPSIKRSL